MKDGPEKNALEYCSQEYDAFARFTSYFYQVDIIRKLNPERLLEVGVGNKTVSDYLRKCGLNITTCDRDSHLAPDIIADIRTMPFEKNSFDVVAAFEILEHLPWPEVDKALQELRRVAADYVVISLPYVSIYLEIAVKVPMFNKLFGRPCLDFFLRWPFALAARCSPSHEWEMGLRGFSLGKIRKKLREHFAIEREIRPILNPRHYFFVLKKRR